MVSCKQHTDRSCCLCFYFGHLSLSLRMFRPFTSFDYWSNWFQTHHYAVYFLNELTVPHLKYKTQNYEFLPSYFFWFFWVEKQVHLSSIISTLVTFLSVASVSNTCVWNVLLSCAQPVLGVIIEVKNSFCRVLLVFPL